MVKSDKKGEVSCPKCGSAMDIKEENDAAEVLDELAEQTGANVEVVSAYTREGEQLLEMGGIAGILRYNV
jgi:peptide subunit release factor 1 (eRF1)